MTNVICNIYVSKKHAALKLNILVSSYDIKCFCRTWILWRPFPYWLWEWDEGYIYIISWLEQGCCFCEQLQHWKILAGKILCILFCYLFMNSSYIYFLIINLCFAYFTLNCFFFRHVDHSVPFMFPGQSSDLETTSLYVLYLFLYTLLGYDYFSCFCCTFSENSGKIAWSFLCSEKKVNI